MSLNAHQTLIAEKKKEEELIEMAKQSYNMKFTKKENKTIGTFFGQNVFKPLPPIHNNNFTIYTKYLKFIHSKKFIVSQKKIIINHIKNIPIDEIADIIRESDRRFIVERFIRYHIQYNIKRIWNSATPQKKKLNYNNMFENLSSKNKAFLNMFKSRKISVEKEYLNNYQP